MPQHYLCAGLRKERLLRTAPTAGLAAVLSHVSFVLRAFARFRPLVALGLQGVSGWLESRFQFGH